MDDNLIFISATFQGKIDKKNNIQKKINNLIEKKKKDQPSKIKTCGSTFKNHDNYKAWKLIKDSGCAGMKIGDAYISEKHCNFFVNKGHAKSSDLALPLLTKKLQCFSEIQASPIFIPAHPESFISFQALRFS